MRIFGIDPGSERTGYGCVESDGRTTRLVMYGVISALPSDAFPQRLARIHQELSEALIRCTPDCVAIEDLFHSTARLVGHPLALRLDAGELQGIVDQIAAVSSRPAA